MSTVLEQAEQIFWLDHSVQPPTLSPEELENFLSRIRHVGYEAIAGVRPVGPRRASIGHLITDLGFGGKMMLETGAVAGPYIWTGGQTGYVPEGVMLYRKVEGNKGE